MTVPVPSVTTQFVDKGSGVGATNPKQTMFVLGIATGMFALLSAVTSTGTTPPVVTVAGYPTGNYTVHVDMDLGGARGTATFRWSIDGGLTWVAAGVVTAATVALGSTGITVAFPTGTYNADNLYVFTAKEIPVKKYVTPERVVTEFTGGGGVELVSAILTAARGNGATVLFVPVPASVAGSSSGVTASNDSAPAVTLSGTPLDDFEARVEILLGGARGVATYRLSLDGGDTWLGETVTAAAVAIAGTGLTLNFATGTYVLADYYTWTSYAPYYAAADLAAAFDSIKRKGLRGKCAFVVGQVSGATDALKATAAASIFSTISTKIDELATAKIYTVGIMSAPDVTDTSALATGMAASTHESMVVCADPVEFKSAVTQRLQRRPSMFALAQVLARIELSDDAAQDKPECRLNGSVTKIYRDEDQDPQLNDDRFVTCRTFASDRNTFFITNPITRATSGSDFELLQDAFVRDRIKEAFEAYWQKVLSQKLLVNANGTLLSSVAAALESSARNAVLKYLGADLPDIGVLVDRTNDVKTTKEIKYDFVANNFSYNKKISGKGSFANPSLAVAVA